MSVLSIAIPLGDHPLTFYIIRLSRPHKTSPHDRAKPEIKHHRKLTKKHYGKTKKTKTKKLKVNLNLLKTLKTGIR